MKYPTQLLFSLLMAALFFSACSGDDEPAPKPASYLEYSGKVYELKTGVNDFTFPDNEKMLSLGFYTLTQAELMGNVIGGEGPDDNDGFFRGSLVSFVITSPVMRQVEAGTYAFSGGGNKEGSEDYAISFPRIMIEIDGENETGIVIYPVSGEVKIDNADEGYLVNFDFLLSNGQKVIGRYQGNILSMM